MAEIRNMFDTYATVPESPPNTQLSFSDEQKEADTGALHYYLSQSREKMAKAVADDPEKQQTNWFEKLTAVLSQLGEPPQPSTKKAAARPFAPSGGKNVHYEEFMKKMAKVDTDYLKSHNIFYAHGKTKTMAPTLYYVAARLHQDLDVEKLFHFMLKTAQPVISKK
eukprot:CAMPEP_0117064768 /NCGR_PEP_ID=MMETSP0472-20121206/45251_1 /TAXON_ID=693140 ORGANISM="Tiarina fusus, Strain LIS" /NCGR_SAMPLE_ID=MMETSP0472 /ASSEMBLY_ACC=CAM_ASM_000603 /LENGTH=165 /DNA_ID=CAMNT_0004785073 /DNA_START=1013 /DNA_END=1507 /DNA_ORIENTATION=+